MPTSREKLSEKKTKECNETHWGLSVPLVCPIRLVIPFSLFLFSWLFLALFLLKALGQLSVKIASVSFIVEVGGPFYFTLIS